MSEIPQHSDHGEVVRKRRFHVSVAWIFPILAASAALWLVWSNWRSEGPEISIRFETAPGLQAGKSLLIYRGVTAGKITNIELDSALDKVVVRVRLKAFAAELARKNTVFWIDQPTVSLVELSGLESIIQGNSLRARLGDGPPVTDFVGIEHPPLEPLEAPSLMLTLQSTDLPRIARGAPIYHHGVEVGAVSEIKLDEAGNPSIKAVITEPYGDLVKSNARFWRLPGAQVKAGAGGVKVDVPGLASLLQGGIEFDYFGPPGEPVQDEASFTLHSTEFAAKAVSRPFTITFDSGRGFEPGETPITFLGVPIGLVESVTPNFATGKADITARVNSDFEKFLTDRTRFSVERMRISADGVSGLDTILRGIHIACVPNAAGQPADHFAGHSPGNGWNSFKVEEDALCVTLSAKDIPSLEAGAPVLRRGVMVGRVVEKSFADDGSPTLRLMIRRAFAGTVRANSRFWRVAATSMDLGPGGVQFDIAGFAALLQGGVQFDEFGEPGEPAAAESTFPLCSTEFAARCTSAPIWISLEEGQGLVPGLTQLRHRGLPIGIVESVENSGEHVRVTARFEPSRENFRKEGAAFALIRPEVSLQGVSGLETLVSGVYIDCIPGAGDGIRDAFVARSMDAVEAEETDIADVDAGGLELVLSSEGTRISEGAPVLYRGVTVGKVTRKTLSPDTGQANLVVEIEPAYAPLIRTNTKFWDIGGLKASLGFLYVKVDPAPLTTLTLGGVEFATPDDKDMGPRATDGSRFELHDKPRGSWLRWTPALPVSD